MSSWRGGTHLLPACSTDESSRLASTGCCAAHGQETRGGHANPQPYQSYADRMFGCESCFVQQLLRQAARLSTAVCLCDSTSSSRMNMRTFVCHSTYKTKFRHELP